MTAKSKLILITLITVILPLYIFTACSKKDQGNKNATSTAQKAVRYNCPMHPNYISDKPGSCPICGMNLVPMEEAAQKEAPKKTMYRSTMNPKEVSDKPGKDSMGMEMEAFEVEETGSGPKVEGLAAIKLTPEKKQMIGIKTESIKKRNLTRIVRAAGRVAHDPELFYAQQEYIGSLKTYEQAKNLSKGQALDNAKSMVEASKYKLSLMGISEEEINELSQKDAPDNSLLLSKSDDKNFWVYASIYENDIDFVKTGQKAAISVPSEKGEKIYGTLVSLNPVLDLATRSIKARIRADNPPEKIKHQSYLNVEIEVSLGYKLTVPVNAVMDTGTRQVVFVDKGSGVLEPREVKLGSKTDNYYTIISGLSEGEIVVTNANFLIDSESQLKAIK